MPMVRADELQVRQAKIEGCIRLPWLKEAQFVAASGPFRMESGSAVGDEAVGGERGSQFLCKAKYSPKSYQTIWLSAAERIWIANPFRSVEYINVF